MDRRGPRRGLGRGDDVAEHVARGVEELVGQRLALADLLGGVADVLGARHRQQPEAHRVGAVGVDLVDRVDAGSQRLAHPPAVGRLDDRVHVDVGEGDLAGELEPHHHHPRDPQEEDVARRREHVGRVEGGQLGRLLGPAQGRERPQRGGEPRVEHVGIALPARALGRLDADVGLLVLAVPDRDLVAPPQLARDAPGADVAQPLQVAARLRLGMDAHAPVLDGRDRGLGQLVHGHEPLQRDQRLDALAGAVAEGHGVGVGLAVADQPLLGQRRDDLLARLLHGEARVGGARLGGHAPVLADDADLVEVVAAADLEVVGVVAGRDLQRAGAEVGLDVLVGDDRQVAPDEGQHRRGADEVAVALVVGVHRHRGVGQHRLRAHGGDHDLARGVLQRIGDVEQRVGDLAVLDLEVGDRRARPRVPVDQVVVAVDEALVVEVDEDLHHRAHVGVVEREALVVVVHRRAQPLELLDDRCRRTARATPTRARRTPRGRSPRGSCPRPAAGARPASGSRCPRGRCRGSTSRGARASAGSGSGSPGSSR